jgi:hypothetical protein
MVNFFHPCCSYLYHSVITITTRKDGYDINDFYLVLQSVYFQSLLSLSLSHNRMASPNGNHGYKDNKRNIDIPSTTPAIERRMLEYMVTQTQTRQAMAQTMVNIHQYIIEQASNPKNPSLVMGENRQIPSAPPSSDKEKLSVMQAQVLQGHKQTSTSSTHITEITNTGVSAGPVKKQVVEVWNHQNNKRSHGAPELRTNEQHEHMKITGTYQCCEHYGHSCLQKEASLMTNDARQCYHLDINKKMKLCTQNPVLEKKLLKL